jgi:colicin import membrane protein
VASARAAADGATTPAAKKEAGERLAAEAKKVTDAAKRAETALKAAAGVAAVPATKDGRAPVAPGTKTAQAPASPSSEPGQRSGAGVGTREPSTKVRAASSSGSKSARRPEVCRLAGKTISTPGRYVVKVGDTLWRIASVHYGKGERYVRIVRRNESKIVDPDLIYPCQRLYLPAR